jgi:pseudouridylate synthase
MKNHKFLSFKDEVETALEEGIPVVALESTIISHGMPFPENVETASALEDIIRDRGCVPATIAIINGIISIGLDRKEIEFLAQSRDINKVSRRDMPLVLARREHGATTVAGTMMAAAMAGIRVFATGGIGGVHRNSENTMDVSADLQELAATEVAVVCAGVKSILDIPRTLEALETLGVPVICYRTGRFPAFYTPDSGLPAPNRSDSPAEIASILKSKWDAAIKGGILIANPVPAGAEMEAAVIEKAINDASKECDNRGISGKEITPFLLDRVKELTDGKSLEVNIALVKNNAALAAEIAREYSGL